MPLILLNLFKNVNIISVIVFVSFVAIISLFTYTYHSRYDQGYEYGVSEQAEAHRQELEQQWRNHLTKMVKLRRELSTKEIIYIEKEAEKEIIYETIQQEIIKYVSDNNTSTNDNVDPAILYFYRKSISPESGNTTSK